MLDRVREYLIAETDAAKILPCIKQPELLSELDKRTVMQADGRKKRTEVNKCACADLKPRFDYIIFFIIFLCGAN